MFKKINCFRLENNPDDPGEESGCLYYNGRPTGTTIGGCTIEKQFEMEGHFLVIASYGWDCEEYNCITLLDKSFTPISKKHIGFAYRYMTVDAAVPTKDNEILITFQNHSSVIAQICKIPFLPFKPFLRLKQWRYS